MKKNIGVVFFLIFSVILSSVAIAGSNKEVTVDNQVLNKQGVDQDFSSHGSIYGTTETLQPGNIHGTINTPPQIFENNGPVIWCPTFTKKVSLKYIKAMANKGPDIERQRRFGKFRITEEPEYVTFICLENLPTSDMHVDLNDIYTMGKAQDNTDIPLITEGLVYDAILDGVIAMNAHYVLVEVFPKKVSNVAQEGDGFWAGSGGPFGSLNRLNVFSLGYGHGEGAGMGKVEKAGTVLVTFYNRMPPILRKMTRITGATDDVNIGRKYKVPRLDEFRFNTGSYEIKDVLDPEPDDITFVPASGQLAVIEEWKDHCYKEISGNPESNETIWFVGFADERWINEEEGRSGNLILGADRAESLVKLIISDLKERGIPREIIKKRIAFASVGKEHSLSDNLSNNRVVVVVHGKIQ